MANVSQLTRRQSSRELRVQMSIDKVEMSDMRDKLVLENGEGKVTYGTTNPAFEDSAIIKDKIEEVEENEEFIGTGNEEGRESWDSKLQFLLATIGYAVGLGNVWRFPYLAQKNGGGAFLIPYFIMLTIEGIPIFFLELAIGQRLRKGAIGVWSQVSPYLGGIGITSSLVSFNVAIYYNTIIAWCLYYLFHSFQSPLPWSSCPNEFFDNGSYIVTPECERSSPTQYFWYRDTLNISNDVNNPVSMNWKIVLCLLVAWFLVYLCMLKGIASSGKVVYVTATFPYFVLIIFFFRGMTLDGMKDGVMHFFTPKWDKLSDPVVWLEAGTQIFFSLGLGFGGLIAFSSYNSVTSNCYKDALLVSFANCFTSMFAGIVVFSIIGFKAHLTHNKCMAERNTTLMSLFNSTYYPDETSINNASIVGQIMATLPTCNLQEELDNTASGTGLAFIIFCEAINQFPGWPQIWSLLFFLMLFTLGIDSQFGTLEGVVTSIVDMKIFPNLRKEILTGVLCLICFVISLCFAHGGGNYIFTMFDDFSGNIPLLVIALFECIGVAYVYGLTRFSDDIELMTGYRPHVFWLFTWRYLAPLSMIVILISSFTKMAVNGSGYPAWNAAEGKTEFHSWPLWCWVIIAILILISTLSIPFIAITRYFNWRILDDEDSPWFPTQELKEFRKFKPHKPTAAEKFLLCMDDEGNDLCFGWMSPKVEDDEDR